MVELPLSKKIRRKKHIDIALAQDDLVRALYYYFPKAIIHGGTAIWRCFSGNRFSEDIDVYLSKKDISKLEAFKKALVEFGFETKKFKKTNNAFFFTLKHDNGAVVKFEGVIKEIKNPVTEGYELIDGNFMVVKTLSLEDFLSEKIDAYLNRYKVRDLYDVFFLLQKVSPQKSLKKKIKNFLDRYREPIDKKNLPSLIIVGTVPRVDDMLKTIQRWAK